MSDAFVSSFLATSSWSAFLSTACVLPSSASSAAFNASLALLTSSWVASFLSNTFCASASAWSYAAFLSGSALLYLSEPVIASSLFLSTSAWSGFLSTAGASASAAFAVASSDGVFPSSWATAFTVWSFVRAGVSTVQLPLSFAFVSFTVPSGSVTFTVAPGVAVPDTVVSPTFGSVTVGVAVFSAGVSASFQTAYTVVSSFNVATSTSASLASAVFAQPTNSFPSWVGVGACTPSFISSVFVVELSSNLPPFASNVTSFSSDQIAYTTWCVVIGVSAVNFIEASRLLKAADLTVVAPSLVLPASVTQPRNVFPSAVGSFTNSSPVPAWTLSPVNPLATYPSSSRYFMLSGAILTDFLLLSANCPSVVSNKILVLTLVTTNSVGKEDPSDALK